MTPEQHKALVRRYIETVWNQGDPSVIDELVAQDYIQHAKGVPPGRAGVQQFFTALRAAFPDIHNTIEDMLAEGDKVVWRSTIRGTHTGPFRGIPPTGKQVTITAINILRIVDGQFVENWGEQDNLGLMQQLGVIPSPEHVGG
jgi:steroid delta-isomerase-like uncharacterized protein